MATFGQCVPALPVWEAVLGPLAGALLLHALRVHERRLGSVTVGRGRGGDLRDTFLRPDLQKVLGAGGVVVVRVAVVIGEVMMEVVEVMVEVITLMTVGVVMGMVWCC